MEDFVFRSTILITLNQSYEIMCSLTLQRNHVLNTKPVVKAVSM